MARGWHYTKLSLSSALLLSFSYGMCFVLLFFSFSRLLLFLVLFLFFMLPLELCTTVDVPLFFSVQQTTYRVGNHVYYRVWLRPDRLM